MGTGVDPGAATATVRGGSKLADDWRPLVSVAMPSLNQAQYIEQAVASVLDQGGPDLELVIADGGSVDGTLERLDALGRRYGARLSWVAEPDSGPANAVNKALGRARGEILGWLNSDDLYAQGAIARALECLTAHPDLAMVYGQGEHIDAEGRSLGAYPTLPPEVGMGAFHGGCFICQPTAFIRRSALEAVGPLDEGLATAFDFDLWLRIFQRFPGRIGFIDRVQAYSRLHADCITHRQRRLVAEEGVRLLARYLGAAEDHWLRTHIGEILAAYPFGEVADDLAGYVAAFVRGLEGCLHPLAVQRLWADLNADQRLRLALPGIYVDIYPDGWASGALEIRLALAPDAPGPAVLRLACEHPFGALALTLSSDWGAQWRMDVPGPGPFLIEIPLVGAPVGEAARVQVAADPAFVPSRTTPGSDDHRSLAFRVRQVQLGAADGPGR